MMKLSGADILIKCLEEQGVSTVFGYPGGAVLDVYDALYRNGKIRHILTAHEQGAAHAADGYARVTGKVGVCFATSGPGATNLVTGIATAYMDSVPMVAITGNVGINFLGRDSFQEVDICGITMPITKHNFIVKDVSELAATIRKAFYIAESGRKGPVLVDILKNVQVSECEYLPLTLEKPATKRVAAEKLKDIAGAIQKSKKPVIIAGGGVVASDSSHLLRELTEKCDIPVVYTLMGKGCVPDGSPLCLGMLGMHGTAQAVKAVLTADTIIALGTRFSDRVALNRDNFAQNKTVIQIDIDAAEIDKNVSTTLHLMADLKQALTTLLPLLEKTERKQWRAELKGYEKPPHITRATQIIEAASRLFPEDSPLVTDVGQHQMWTAQAYALKSPQLFCTSGGLGTMGYGIGAAIGATIGSGKPAVLITGDGCIGMNMNEISTAAANNVPLVILLMNNRVLGMVRQWQKIFYGRRFSQTNLERKIDYVMLAESMGASGIVLGETDDIEQTLKTAYEAAVKNSVPVLVDCRISPDENVLPMIQPGKTYGDQLNKMEEE